MSRLRLLGVLGRLSSKQAELEVGAGDVAGDAVAKKIVKPVMSQ